MKWIATDEKLPFKDGKYWVYPYRSLAGHIKVTLANFEDGKWEKGYQEQEYVYWQPLEIPKIPKVKYLENVRGNYKSNKSFS